MESVSGALMAGYSLESAWKYAQQETEQMYGIQGIFSRELRQLNQKLFMHEPMEQLLYELAERCDNEEIYHFAEILLYAKRSGGNMQKLFTEPCVACRRSMRFCGKLQQMWLQSVRNRK